MIDDPIKEFENTKRRKIEVMSDDRELADLGHRWFVRGYEHQ